MPSIGAQNLGIRLDLSTDNNYVRYEDAEDENSRYGVRPHTQDARLVALTQLPRFGQPSSAVVPWNACSPSVKSDIKRKFGLRSSPPPELVGSSLQPSIPASANTSQVVNVRPSVTLSSNVPEAIRSIVPAVLRRIALPAGYDRVGVEVGSLGGDFGTTRSNLDDRMAYVTIDYGAIRDRSLSSSEVRAHCAETLAHEVFLHAAPDLIGMSRNLEFGSERSQHRNLYRPADESNAFYRFTLRVRDSLPEEQQNHFMKCYIDDVRKHAGNSTTTDEFLVELTHVHLGGESDMDDEI